MKKGFCGVLALLLVFAVVLPAMAYSGDSYYNTKYDYYYTGNHYMSDWTWDLRDNYGATWYEAPQRNVERSEVFLLGWRIINNSLSRQRLTTLSTEYMKMPFTDINVLVPSAQTEIRGLYSMNIIKGYKEEDGTMTARLTNPITRAEMAAVYVRFNAMWLHMGVGYNSDDYMGYDSYYSSNTSYYNSYNFGDTWNHWAKQEISIAASNGILKGMPDGNYYPEENLSVEQLWAIVDRWIGYGGIEIEDVAKGLEQTFRVKCENVNTGSSSSSYYSGTRVSSISAASTTKTIEKFITTMITFNVYPASIANLKVECTSSNNSAVSIEDYWYTRGKITVQVKGFKVGNKIATIKVRALDGSSKYATTQISVTNSGSGNYYDEEISSLTLSQSNITLYRSDSKQINVRIYPSDAYYKELSYESMNDSIAYVKNVYESGSYSYATIVANKAGSTTIKVRTLDGSNITKTIYVTVKSGTSYDDDYDDGYITSISPSNSSISLKKNRTEEVYFVIRPSSAYDKNLKLTTSNSNVARVIDQWISGNKVYATIEGINAGSATIRARAQDGSNEVAEVYVSVTNPGGTVDPPNAQAPSVTLEGATSVKVGQFIELRAKVSGSFDNFTIDASSIVGGTQGLSVQSITPISGSEYKIILMGVEVGSQCICVKARAASYNGLYSAESNEVVIYINANE